MTWIVICYKSKVTSKNEILLGFQEHASKRQKCEKQILCVVLSSNLSEDISLCYLDCGSCLLRPSMLDDSVLELSGIIRSE